MRWEDILFTQGFGTRYDCRTMILAGQVSVDGVVHDSLEEEVDTEGLQFTVRGETWPFFEKAIVALHKPDGYECSTKPSAHPSVMTLLPAPLRRRGLQPVGRLDVDTTGLLLFTDDGRLQHRLIHPKRHVPKVYEVFVKHPTTERFFEQLRTGVVLDDSPVPVRAQVVEPVDERHFRMTLTQGKYHQVKRMVAAASNRVERLHRSAFGAYTMPETLKPGEWVWLSGPEAILGA